LVSVTERTREIGLRKAIGARRRDILAQFLMEAIVLSVCGGLIGILIGSSLASVSGLVISKLMNASWPAVVSVQAALIAFSVSAFIGVFFGLYPANKAASLTPTEALRHE
jgi:putative ABC transport system permease protein